MKLPEDKQLIKGEIADYWYSPEGILYSYSKNPKRTIKNISENGEIEKKINHDKKPPLLIYLCNSPVPDKETRKFSSEQITKK